MIGRGVYFLLTPPLSGLDHRYLLLYASVCPGALFATKASEISIMPLKIA